MPRVKKTTDRDHRYTLRLDRASYLFIESQAKTGDFRAGPDYIRWLIKKAQGGESAALEDLQASILNTLGNTDQEIDRLRQQGNALFSLTVAFVRTFLHSSPELPQEQRRVAAAGVNKRFDLIMQAVRQDFRSGDSTAMERLLRESHASD